MSLRVVYYSARVRRAQLFGILFSLPLLIDEEERRESFHSRNFYIYIGANETDCQKPRALNESQFSANLSREKTDQAHSVYRTNYYAADTTMRRGTMPATTRIAGDRNLSTVLKRAREHTTGLRVYHP